MAELRVPQLRVLILGLAPAVAVVALLAAGGLIGIGPALTIVAAIVAGGWWIATRPPAAQGTDETEHIAAAPGLPEHLLDQLPDPVILLNDAREIVAINRQARDVLGIGATGRDLALSLRHPAVFAAVETVSSGVPSITEEITLPVPVPRSFTLHVGGLPGTAGTDAPGMVLVLHDETRAKRAEQSRADFVANVSHELRSPLSAVIGFIETLLGHARDDAEARERFLGVMHSEAQRMSRLVNDLLSLARVEINEHVPPRGIVYLEDVFNGVADSLQVRAAEKDISIVVSCDPDLPPVIGEADQIVQVFQNLVDNAIKYGRADTEIRIEANAVGRMPGSDAAGVAASVTDQGEGIAAEHLPRLTERFYRVDEGRSRRLGGTGLGLAIVKHIVNRHRGQIRVDSEEGVGTTVTVFLPARPETDENGEDESEITRFSTGGDVTKA